MSKRPNMKSVLPSVAVMQQTNAGLEARMVRLDTIHIIPRHNPRYSRRDTAPELQAADLEDILPSIQRQGVLTPLLVRPDPHREPGHFQLVAGYRRFCAAKLAQLEEVPVFVKELSDRQLLEAALAENNARQDPDQYHNDMAVLEQISLITGVALLDLPSYLNRLRNGTEEDTHGVSDTLAGLGLGKLETWARKRARILFLKPSEVKAVEQGQLSLKAALELPYLKTHPAREQLLEDGIEQQWSAEQMRAAVQALLKPDRPAAVSTLEALRPHLSEEAWAKLSPKKRQVAEQHLTKLLRLLQG
ncbi:ParB/RepB/Spo0J family partition protein [Deinococcus multiflagellatus]|uniref:ParB/RepB/Spo0J family partition protein n=1 Tax=Deinococcus multiflagellatus TaxID=1656887 RepID=A0ABW1ZQC4_9DEIO|nr:ParB/RepB/Spo0J family partition protein [Deinococcus multiflagellatus]MBZ9715802.1 ParB/RepB/Spo0J family partition protein [Deinococcus multiflagellatus]